MKMYFSQKLVVLSLAVGLLLDCGHSFQLLPSHTAPTIIPSTKHHSFKYSTYKTQQSILTATNTNQDEDDYDDDDDAWDSPEDYDDEESNKQSFGNQPSLGIDIGSQLQPLTPEQAQSLKYEATEKINKAFDDRLQEIENMKKTIQDDFEKSKKNLQYASELRAREETEKLMNKIDRLSNDFLSENEELRMGTKFSAQADRNNMDGRGLEVGSWGSVGGMDVGMGMGLSDGSGSGVLGSIGSMRSNGEGSIASDDDDLFEDEIEEEVDNRILVITDDKQVSFSNMTT